MRILYGFQKDVIFLIFALRTQLANSIRFDFLIVIFLNVGGWQRDLKCAFLGESGMSIRSR